MEQSRSQKKKNKSSQKVKPQEVKHQSPQEVKHESPQEVKHESPQEVKHESHEKIKHGSHGQRSDWEKRMLRSVVQPSGFSFYAGRLHPNVKKDAVPKSSERSTEAPSAVDKAATHESKISEGSYESEDIARAELGVKTSLGGSKDKKAPKMQVLTQNYQYGYPGPGEQYPSTNSVMLSNNFFVTDELWKDVLNTGEFDYIVIGTGFTALAFVDQVYSQNPRAKILMLERGSFWLPEHFQNLPLPFQYTLGGPSETFPWTLSKNTLTNTDFKFMRGSCPFFGGRSNFWSAWSPIPKVTQMRDWPSFMISTTAGANFWTDCSKLLNVTDADKIGDKVYSVLQEELFQRIFNKKGHIKGVDRVIPAPLAVGNPSSIDVRFLKFSTPGPLLAIAEKQRMKTIRKEGNPLYIKTDCVVEKFITFNKSEVTAIQTSQGDLAIGDAKVILAAGMFPAVNILLNSFPENDSVQRAGKRITGHFITHVTARIPKSKFPGLMKPDMKDRLQIAAIYVDGEDKNSRLQYHVQITGITAPHPEVDAFDAARECPDYAAAASPQQLKNSENYVLLVCATLGELSENSGSEVKLNKGTDITCNVDLDVVQSEIDSNLWTMMDGATFDCIEAMSIQSQDIEYWHADNERFWWDKIRPNTSEIRAQGVVHEASGFYMGVDPTNSVVGPDYRPHGVQNVFLTGAGLFPTSGSWNPTLTMCGFAQDLAQKLEKQLS